MNKQCDDSATENRRVQPPEQLIKYIASGNYTVDGRSYVIYHSLKTKRNEKLDSQVNFWFLINNISTFLP